MRDKPRKNWRGFVPHIRSVLETLIKSGEFPRIKKHISTREFIATKRGLRVKEHFDIKLNIIPFTMDVECPEDILDPAPDTIFDRSLAIAGDVFGDEANLEKDKYIELTIVSREDWLKFDDKKINSLLRHELLHHELDKSDSDIEFIEECVRREIHINKSSDKVLYAHRISENLKFDKVLFEYCFREGIAYWAKFCPMIK